MTTPVETPAPPKKRISGAWYVLVALPWVMAIAIWYVHLPRVIASFTSLGSQSFESHVGPAPAENDVNAFAELHEVTLRPGANTLYVEGVRVGDRTEPRTTLSCVMFDRDGHTIELERDTTSTMTLNSSRYASQYEATVEAAGTYRVSCSSEISARFSIGRSFALFSIALLVLSLVLALPLTGVIGYLVNRVRNPKTPKVPASIPNRSL